MMAAVAPKDEADSATAPAPNGAGPPPLAGGKRTRAATAAEAASSAGLTSFLRQSQWPGAAGQVGQEQQPSQPSLTAAAAAAAAEASQDAAEKVMPPAGAPRTDNSATNSPQFSSSGNGHGTNSTTSSSSSSSSAEAAAAVTYEYLNNLPGGNFEAASKSTDSVSLADSRTSSNGGSGSGNSPLNHADTAGSSNGGTSDSSRGRKHKKPRKSAPFLRCLLDIIRNESTDIIEWHQESDSKVQLTVWDPESLVQEIFPKYFGHSKYSSFKRQLNYFDFCKLPPIKEMPHVCRYRHSSLVGKDPEAILKLPRKKSEPSNKNRSNKWLEETPHTNTIQQQQHYHYQQQQHQRHHPHHFDSLMHHYSQMGGGAGKVLGPLPIPSQQARVYPSMHHRGNGEVLHGGGGMIPASYDSSTLGGMDNGSHSQNAVDDASARQHRASMGYPLYSNMLTVPPPAPGLGGGVYCGLPSPALDPLQSSLMMPNPQQQQWGGALPMHFQQPQSAGAGMQSSYMQPSVLHNGWGLPQQAQANNDSFHVMGSSEDVSFMSPWQGGD